MAMASAAAFGPNGGMGMGDDPQDAHLAVDGRRGTAWHTGWYTTPRFGNLYRGTGLIVDMGRPVTVTAVRVTLGPAAGAHFQIRVGNQQALAAMTPVALRPARRGGPADVGQPGAGALRAGLVYQAAAGSAGTFKAAVYGISVKGQP